MRVRGLLLAFVNMHRSSGAACSAIHVRTRAIGACASCVPVSHVVVYLAQPEQNGHKAESVVATIIRSSLLFVIGFHRSP